MHARKWLGTVALGLALAACGQVSDLVSGKKSEADVKLAEYPDQVYFGDTHLHTSNSSDAFGLGVRLGPEEAFRFAMGEEVTSTTGIKTKLSRPLDFLVIADHSDGLAALKQIHDAPRFMLTDPILRRWHDELQKGPKESQKVAMELIDRFSQRTLPPEMLDPKAQEKRTRDIWTDHTSIVERYNSPGKFTAFMGFEYTLMRKGDNLHRVVVMRDGKDKADQVLPFSSLIGTTPDQLWDYMDAYEKKTGGKILAIPHNSNVSNGLMFQLTGPGGGPMSADYARRRAAREPIVEATQIKGDSESHPFLSPNDEFADFGDAGWELGNLTMEGKKTPDMLAGDYVREALKRGLLIEQRTGVNPYKLGMIGSTDSHTGLATADEDNFFGKHSGNEPSAHRATDPQSLGTRAARIGWHYLAGGYAAVWARANTRGAIFDAMMKREVYATTGPRMKVRVFGGWDFTDADWKANWVKAGYTRGVPMGSDLKAGKAAGAPRFLISALKDSMGANLDRVQMVKGWVDKSGKAQEKVFDVVWSDPAKRKIVNGRLTPVGDTVDLKTASYKNSIGAPELRAVWTDPEFDPKVRAFYYVRVLEIPTPRWPVYDAVRYGAKLPKDARLKDQERAYTSPIWYKPSA
jgi:Protein of unknown function (DUF3604)